MISIVVPALNAAESLCATLAAVEGSDAALVREIVVSDGGSTDETRAVAAKAGAQIIVGPKGRGGQLKRGAAAATGDWLLFLHADTVLDPAWTDEARLIMREPMTAAAFTLAFDSGSVGAKAVAFGANIRTRLFALPYGDQGLLISRAHYDAVGGYRDMPLFEDVDIIDRIVARGGRRALRLLKTRAVTSAERYERRGYARQVFDNLAAIARYRLGVPAENIAEDYGK
ncbi:MAG: TIGR04283 family arsenosugar biosynthesis glycosyltransferase [Parvularculaceae bacterium]